MKPVVLIPNSSGKIELTKEELQKLLDDAYEQGKKDAPSKIEYIPYTTPAWQPPYVVDCKTSNPFEIRLNG